MPSAMLALRAISLVVVASNPFVWNRFNAAVTMRARIAALFCARRPAGRGARAASRGLVLDVDRFVVAIALNT